MGKRYRLIALLAAVLLAAVGIYAFTDGHTAEAVTIRGMVLPETGEEFKVERKEDVAMLVGAFENAERTEGAVTAIGNNYTFTFHLENGYAIEYLVWKGTNGANFQDPTKKTVTEQGDVRFRIADEDWEKVLELLEEGR